MITKECLEKLISEAQAKIQACVDMANSTNSEVQAYRKLLAEFDKPVAPLENGEVLEPEKVEE